MESLPVLNYLYEVLGIESIIQIEDTGNALSNLNNSSGVLDISGNDKIQLLNPTDNGQVHRRLFFLSTQDLRANYLLLEKMITAMGLKTEECWVGVCSKNIVMEDLSSYSSDIIVCLGKNLIQNRETELFGQLVDTKNLKILATYSTQELIENPNLKKDCWNHLKMVMNQLNRKKI